MNFTDHRINEIFTSVKQKIGKSSQSNEEQIEIKKEQEILDSNAELDESQTEPRFLRGLSSIPKKERVRYFFTTLPFFLFIVSAIVICCKVNGKCVCWDKDNFDELYPNLDQPEPQPQVRADIEYGWFEKVFGIVPENLNATGRVEQPSMEAPAQVAPLQYPQVPGGYGQF